MPRLTNNIILLLLDVALISLATPDNAVQHNKIIIEIFIITFLKYFISFFQIILQKNAIALSEHQIPIIAFITRCYFSYLPRCGRVSKGMTGICIRYVVYH